MNAMIAMGGKVVNPLEIDQQIAQTRGLENNNKLFDMKVQEQAAAQESARAMNELTRQSFNTSTGKLDDQKFMAGLGARGDYKGLMGHQEAVAKQGKLAGDAEKERLGNIKSSLELQGQLLGTVKDAPSYMRALQVAAANGMDISKFPQQYDQNFVAEAKARQLTEVQKLEQEWKAKGYDLDLRKQGEVERHDKSMEGASWAHVGIARDKAKQEVTGQDTGFSPEAIANAAARYNIDGTLPPMGMGKTGSSGRAAILNEAARQANISGVSSDDQRIAQIGNKANSAALAKIQQQQTMVSAFEKNFVRNADIALEYSGKVDRTGVPLANKWINAGKRSIAGDPELAAFDASVKAVSNEYAKIVSGSMGNTATAEGEIKKIEGLLNAAQTPAQVKAVIELMKRETANRMKGFDEEKEALRSTMGRKKPAAEGAPSTKSGATVSNW